jgi:site-specific DNA recombinase
VPPTAAAIYCRQSRDPDLTKAAVTRQETVCRELATHLGWTITAVYTDSDISAYSGKRRPGYDALLDAVRAGAINGLLLYSTDRLYRRMTDLEVFLAVAEPHKLPVATVAAGHVDLGTDQGRMIARILAATAQGEVERKAHRQRLANDQRAGQGVPHWSRRPYGYHRTNGVITIDETEAAIIREAVTRLLAGDQTGTICNDLNQRGVRTSTGHTWRVSTLRRIAGSTRIAGLNVHRGQVIGDGAWPAIITADQHARITALFADPTRLANGGNNRVKFLLGGIAHCGRCDDQKMASFRSAYGVRTYRCAVCFLQRKADPVDDVVTRAVLGRLKQRDVRRRLRKSMSPAATSPGRTVADLEDVRRRQGFIAAQYAAGTLSDAAFRRADVELAAREKELTDRMAATIDSDPFTTVLAAKDIDAKWAQLPITARRKIVARLVHIRVMPAKVGTVFDPTLVQITYRSD